MVSIISSRVAAEFAGSFLVLRVAANNRVGCVVPLSDSCRGQESARGKTPFLGHHLAFRQHGAVQRVRYLASSQYEPRLFSLSVGIWASVEAGGDEIIAAVSARA